jgi:hypothetical protein
MTLNEIYAIKGKFPLVVYHKHHGTAWHFVTWLDFDFVKKQGVGIVTPIETHVLVVKKEENGIDCNFEKIIGFDLNDEDDRNRDLWSLTPIEESE